jgi:glycosyltransferase involved in cell wall biosynthesis/lysophospholipid acyltransferase (LPLAT)-like uncharacterized protein
LNILMLTNTFTPHVGGVARSVQSFTEAFRNKGHRVLVGAPLFNGAPRDEPDVIRFSAVTDFNGSDFSVPMPEPLRLTSALRTFKPAIVHSHHPFLLGATALRLSVARGLPLIFTHHTMYERYIHYVGGGSPKLKRFVVDLVTGYCNLCDAVIAPSQTVADLLLERGVQRPIAVIPTGVDNALAQAADRAAFRSQLNLPADAFLVGHVGRLAPEKNLEFLTKAVIRFLKQDPRSFFLIVGSGPLQEEIHAAFSAEGFIGRLRTIDVLMPKPLASAYSAMDVFAFASHTETQGMVLAEAMAAGVPVVGVDASGTRDIVQDGDNGRLIRRDDTEMFAAALEWIASLPREERARISDNARRTAAQLDISRTAEQALGLYQSLIGITPSEKRLTDSLWATTYRHLKGEWRLLKNIFSAAGCSFRPRLVWEVEPPEQQENAAWCTQDIQSQSLATETEPMTPTPERQTTSLRAKIFGWFWSFILRVQFLTWRKRYEGLDELDQLLSEGHKVLFSFWHGKYVPIFALLRGRSACVFTSESARGEVIAEICRRFGYECVQIPTHGQGQALEMMRRALAHSQNGGIAVDGPGGPYHRVKRGAIKLASDLGYVIIPGSASALRKRIVKHRWDRLELPGLFTSVGFAVGKPIWVPPDLPPDQLRAYAELLRETLESLDHRAAELAGAHGQASRFDLMTTVKSEAQAVE